MSVLYVFLGGGAGAVCRWAISSGVAMWIPLRFPLGILICNGLGSFLIGFVSGCCLQRGEGFLGPFLVVGFLGSFTTFSTFAMDTQKLFSAGLFVWAVTNVLCSVLASLGAVWFGLKLSVS